MAAALVPELYVSDFARSLDFYTQLLGFEVSYTRPEDNFAYLSREGAELMIEQPGERVWLRGQLVHPYGCGVSLQISATEVPRLYTALEAQVEMHLPLETRDYRRRTDIVTLAQFVLVDPDGYLLRFSEAVGTCAA